MKHLLIYLTLAISGPAIAQQSGGQTNSSVLSEFDGALGDKWAPYISLMGLTNLKPWGQAKAYDANNTPIDVNMTSLAAGAVQIGTYISETDNPWHLRVNLGYSFAPIESDLGTTQFSSLAFGLMPFYEVREHRLGIGINQPIKSTLNAKNADNAIYALDNSLGYAAEYGFNVHSLNTWINVRYQMNKYSIAKGLELFADDHLVDQSIGVGLEIHFL